MHGYSVRTLNSWGRLPSILQVDGFTPASLYYSAFVSLDDYVSCDDLAAALEDQIASLEQRGLTLAKTALIAHSTGAIITRRWMLNRRTQGKPSPSHFISCAGANHGSTLAQLGRGELARAFRGLTQASSVGQRVLADLDYGSDFLRLLNRDWLDAWNDPDPHSIKAHTALALVGPTISTGKTTSHGNRAKPGRTVPCASPAPILTRIISVEPPYKMMTTKRLLYPAPHLIVETPQKRYSHTSEAQPDTLGLVMSGAQNAINRITHFGRDAEPVSSTASGILEGILAPDERPYQALKEAMAVDSITSYRQVTSAWSAESAA